MDMKRDLLIAGASRANHKLRTRGPAGTVKPRMPLAVVSARGTVVDLARLDAIS